MFVSVVIVTRNRPQALLCCLQSVAAQDYQDMEVIVVDNASSGDTAAIIAAAYPSATILHQAINAGAPEGRNIGIRHAGGEICVCMDDDAELIGTTAISQCVDYFRKDEKLGCLSMRVLDDQGKIVKKLIPRRDRKVIDEDVHGALFSATGCALRRSAFWEVGGFWADLNPYFGEEPDLSYRLLDKGYHILQTPHISVHHHEAKAERHKSRRLYYGARNAPWLALRNLPWYSVIGLTILSWGYFFLVSIYELQMLMFFRAVAASIRHMPAVYRIRKPISRQTQRLLWRHSGLILF